MVVGAPKHLDPLSMFVTWILPTRSPRDATPRSKKKTVRCVTILNLVGGYLWVVAIFVAFQNISRSMSLSEPFWVSSIFNSLNYARKSLGTFQFTRWFQSLHRVTGVILRTESTLVDGFVPFQVKLLALKLKQVWSSLPGLLVKLVTRFGHQLVLVRPSSFSFATQKLCFFSQFVDCNYFCNCQNYIKIFHFMFHCSIYNPPQKHQIALHFMPWISFPGRFRAKYGGLPRGQEMGLAIDLKIHQIVIDWAEAKPDSPVTGSIFTVGIPITSHETCANCTSRLEWK